MIINFADIRFKQAPAGSNGMSISLTENDPTIPIPTDQRQVAINTDDFTPEQMTALTDFIALIKSKLP
jgi:hypothetical protein